MSKRGRSKSSLIIMLGLMIYFGYKVVEQEKILYAKRNEMKVMNSKIEEEQTINKELQKQKELINSDEYIEKMAREKLGMIKSDEKVFVDINK